MTRRTQRGTITRLPNGKWRLRVSRTVNGVRRTKSRTISGTKRAANAALTKMLAELDAGHVAFAPHMTFKEFFDKWLVESLRRRVSPRTERGYSDAARLYLIPEIGHLRLSAIQHDTIQRIYNRLTDTGYSPATVRYVHAVLSASLKDAVRQQLLTTNPAAHVSLPKRNTQRTFRALTVDELRRFLEASASSNHHALYALLAETGMRPGEAFALSWDHVSLTNRVLVVERSVSVDAEGSPMLKSTKSGRTRRIAFGEQLAAILRQHKAATQHVPNPLGLVFPRIDGSLIHPRNFSRNDFKRTLKRAGLPTDVRLYDLRHTSATLGLAANLHPKVVSERLGHASIQLTLDTYSHVVPHLQEEAGETLAQTIYSNNDNDDED